MSTVSMTNLGIVGAPVLWDLGNKVETIASSNEVTLALVTVKACFCLPALWPHVPDRTIVSGTSNIPQDDIGEYLGLHILFGNLRKQSGCAEFALHMFSCCKVTPSA